MSYNEALGICFEKYGRRETFIWIDCNNMTHDEVIKEAIKIKEKESSVAR